jgi:hypothetical protein
MFAPRTHALTAFAAAPRLLALLTLASCGGDEKAGRDSAGGATAVALVGAEGGTITLDNGASVTIPAGALTEDVEVTVEFVEDLSALGLAALPEGVEAGGGALVLSPHGTTFELPVTVTMPTSLSGDDVVVWRLPDEASTEWAPDGAVTVEDGVLSFPVLSFSVYSPAAVAAGACPCYSGADLNTWAAANRSARFSVYYYLGKVFGYANPPRASSGARVPGVGTLSVGSAGSTTCQAPSGTRTTTTRAQHNACNALAFARFRTASRSNLQVGAHAQGLAAGETVTLQVTASPPTGAATSEALELPHTDELVWLSGVYPSGTQVTASITAAPPGASCAVTAGTGPLGTDNVAVQVDCTASASTPCDANLSGVWDVDPAAAGGPITVTGTRSAFTFPVDGGSVAGEVLATDIITGTVTIGTEPPITLDPGSVYACDPAGDETMTFVFSLSGATRSVTLTAR